jgi:hypothetical protein
MVNDTWRKNREDLFSSIAVHGPISLVMKGRHYDLAGFVEVTIKQAGFFFQVVCYLIFLLLCRKTS